VHAVVVALGLVGAIVITASVWPEDEAPTPAQACRFDFPVAPFADYYDAQPFGENDHLGADLNGKGGGDTDLGDPVHAVADGVVSEATDVGSAEGGGWGNVVRIVHPCAQVESLYAHLDTMLVERGAVVTRGQQIGTIGTAHGAYKAHLHFELRDRHLPLGGGYGTDHTGYVDPIAFIRRSASRR
jgi:murein DD-endopeptidase MepM/ murein hydrolase activator NlpD